MWRDVFRDLWKVIQRYPLLAWLPVTLYMRFFEPDKLKQMIDSALSESSARRS